MPLLSTKGGASATGFGMFGESVVFNITTVTYSSSTTWTAPAGVSNILTLTGIGSDGVSDSWSTGNVADAAARALNAGSGGSLKDWSTLYARINSLLTTFNAGSGTRTINFNNLSYFINSTNNAWLVVDNSTSILGRGTYVINPAGDFRATSGTILYSQLSPSGAISNGWVIYGDYCTVGGPGGSSTGFGYTFPGGGYSGSPGSGVGYPASSVTYNNIAVTPGTGYALSIPSGGSIAISYLTPA